MVHNKAQHIRGSQFVIMYGPGAILEGPYGPRIIPCADIGLFSGRLKPEKFEITDERMSKGFLENARIFRLPSNAELKLNESDYIYKTKIFPEWYICSEHWLLFRHRDGCPQCRSTKKGTWDAVRFVMVCRNGHLDDVNWDYAVHMRRGGRCRDNSTQYPKYYEWRSRASSLKDIAVHCPKCGVDANLGWLYQKKDWPCYGRYPEREVLGQPPQRIEGCSSHAEMMLRQASNLRIPEIFTLFTVPPRYTKLHTLLEQTAVKSMLLTMSSNTGEPLNKEVFECGLRSLLEGKMIDKSLFDELMRYPWNETQQAINDILTDSVSAVNKNLLLDEFLMLIYASIKGAPPQRREEVRSQVIFEIPANDIRKLERRTGHVFCIAPITRLRTVIVQKGYRRIDADGEIVDVGFKGPTGEKWYPGAELLGEGIFIRLNDNEGYHPDVDKDAWNTWKECCDDPSSSACSFRFWGGNERNPVFVWWHTLSHFLLRVLAVDSGYSSASIRERVYIESTKAGSRGGLVLYTVQPGEGTMGGLISLVREFGKLLDKARDLAESCPNDPLCVEHKFERGKLIGAACHACTFVSETSCEHRNMWLDRHLLMEYPP